MTFANPQYFHLFWLLLPILLLLFLGHRLRRRNQRRYADVPLLKALKPNTSTAHRIARNALVLLACAFCILALARPQLTRKKDVPTQQKGIECVFALDISNSMLAQDIKPNRIEFAKLVIMRIIDGIGASKVGLVVFAGAPYVQLPITTDLASAKSLVMESNPEMTSNQGTAIAPSIERALTTFSQKAHVGKAIVVLTDGENHDSDAIAAAKEAAKKGVHVYAIAVGTEQGAPILMPNGSYLTDNDGKEVITKANFNFCKELAHAGKGVAFTGTSLSSVSKRMIDELQKLPQAAMDGKGEQNEELFGWFILLAAACLIVAQFIFFRKNKLFSKLRIFER